GPRRRLGAAGALRVACHSGSGTFKNGSRCVTFVGGPIVSDRTAARQKKEQWEVVDEGWGRKAVDFATLTEPANCREYVTMHQRLAVGDGDRILDLACGSGLAVELAGLRGARCAGIDASPRLVAIARDRSPDADLRVGDMNALPWDDESFDV